MKSIYSYAALAAATLVAAKPVAQAASNASSVADATQQAAIQSALAAQQGQNGQQNVNNEQSGQNLQNLQNGLNGAALQSGISSLGSNDALTQLLLEQQAICGVNGLSNLGLGNFNSFVSAGITPNVALFNGIDANELQLLLPFFTDFSGLGSLNGGNINNALLGLNNFNSINGLVFDQNLGLQAAAVFQQGIGAIGVSYIVSGILASEAFPVLDASGNIVQLLSIEQAIAQQVAFQQLLTPILLNNQLVQIFPIDQNVLLASAGVLNGINVVSGVSMAGLGFNLNSGSLWNLNIDNSALGALGLGQANVLALEVGNPFFIASSSLFGNSAISSLSFAAPTIGNNVFLLGSNNLAFNQLGSLGSVAQQLSVPFSGQSFVKN